MDLREHLPALLQLKLVLLDLQHLDLVLIVEVHHDACLLDALDQFEDSGFAFG